MQKPTALTNVLCLNKKDATSRIGTCSGIIIWWKYSYLLLVRKCRWADGKPFYCKPTPTQRPRMRTSKRVCGRVIILMSDLEEAGAVQLEQAEAKTPPQ